MLTVKYNSFKIELPISKITIKIRPFLITEQKVILQAITLEDQEVITEALNDVLKACILDDDIDINRLPYGDVEYLILRLRAISVNDILSLSYRCKNTHEGEVCNNNINFVLPIEKVEIVERFDDGIVDITDKISLKIKEIDYGVLSTIKKGDDYERTCVKNSIEVIYDGDDVYKPSDFTDKELDEFLDSLSINDYTKVKDRCLLLRTVYYENEITCNKCNHTEKLVFKGMQDFLV